MLQYKQVAQISDRLFGYVEKMEFWFSKREANTLELTISALD